MDSSADSKWTVVQCVQYELVSEWSSNGVRGYGCMSGEWGVWYGMGGQW